MAEPETGGWRTLLSIIQQNRDLAEAEQEAAPVDCPVHGDRLETRDGLYHCPLGHLVNP